MADETRRPTIGMALYADLTYDSRVRREAAVLAQSGFDVTVVCLADANPGDDLPANVRVVIHRPTTTDVLPGSGNPFLAGRGGRLAAVARRAGWLRGYVGNLRTWGHEATAAAGQVDAWHAHDLTALIAIAPHVGRSMPLVYDAHELFLESGTAARLPGPFRSLLRAYERRLVARVAAVVTVNDELASVLTERYRPRRIEVVHNCPDRWSLPDRPSTRIRDAAGIPDDEPVILYHGSLGEQRGIEQLIEAILEPGLERAHVVIMGYGPGRDFYRELARGAQWGGRFHVLDAVSPADLLDWVASADLGGMPIQATTLNHFLSTPNKMFECLAAGVPVVASDFPAMRRVVVGGSDGPLGAVCDPARPDAVAAALRSVLELGAADRAVLRARCLAAAATRWNWQVESAHLTGLYRDLLSGPATATAKADPVGTA